MNWNLLRTQIIKMARWLDAETGLIGIQVILLAATRLWQAPAYTDDAFIHFRNALNWARGDGLVFNRGEWVLGSTSAVYAVILGLLHSLTRIDFPRLAEGFNFVADVGVMLIGLTWMKRAGVGMIFRHLFTFIVALEPYRILYSVTGMEMSFFILCVLLIIEFFHRGWWLPGGVLLGLLGWIRPEGAVVWVAVAAALIATRRVQHFWKGYSCAVGVALATSLILYLNYDTFLPQSLSAKAIAPWFKKWGGFCHIQFFIDLGNLTPLYPLNGFVASWGSPADKVNSSVVAIVQIILMAAGTLYLWNRGLRLIAASFSGFVVGYYAFYALSNPQIFFWYFVPYYFGSLYLAGIGWWSFFTWIRERVSLRFPKRQAVIRAGYGAATALLFLCALLTTSNRATTNFFQGDTPWTGLGFRLKGAAPIDREPLYIKVANRMNALVGNQNNLQVGCVEIGIFGYYFHGKVLDSFGLVSPEVLDVLKPEIAEKIDVDCQEHPLNVFVGLQPEFVMSATIWLPLTPPRFLEIYDELDIPEFSIRLFARKDIAQKMELEIRKPGSGLSPELIIPRKQAASAPGREAHS